MMSDPDVPGDEPATFTESVLVLLYVAHFTMLEHAIAAAQLITGHPDWAKFGKPEIAVIDNPEVIVDHHYALVDLDVVPEGRVNAYATIHAGEVTWRR